MKTAEELLGKQKYEHYKKLGMLPMYDLGRAAYIDKDDLIKEMILSCAYRISARKFKENDQKFHIEFSRIMNLSLTEISMEIMAERLMER